MRWRRSWRSAMCCVLTVTDALKLGKGVRMLDPNMMSAILQRVQGGGGPGMAGPSDYGGDPTAGPPPGPGDQPDQAGAPDPLEATKSVIQDLHSLIAVLPDPMHTQVATRAMSMVMSIQKDLMGTKQTATSQGVS